MRHRVSSCEIPVLPIWVIVLYCISGLLMVGLIYVIALFLSK